METKSEMNVIPLKMATATFRLCGTAPYCQNRFPEKARQDIKAKHLAGNTAKKFAKREPKDFQRLFEESTYISQEGWYGIPAVAFKKALVDACRLAGVKMTHAKQAIGDAIPDGYDKRDLTPLVRIVKGERKYTEVPVRNESGVADLRPRPAWPAGWEVVLRLQYDASTFTKEEIRALLERAGQQVGIGEGRPFSPNSTGLGYGKFVVKEV